MSMQFLIIKLNHKNMNQIKIISIIATLFFLFGCNDHGDAGIPDPIVPEVSIEYVDREGKPIMKESELLQQYEKGIFLDIQSVTDEKDKDIEFRFGFNSELHVIISEMFTLESLNTARSYSIKYKYPYLLGESVEELIVIFSVNGWDSKFTKAWYNGEKIDRFVTEAMFYPENTIKPIPEEDLDAIKAYENRRKELLYNGNTVAFIEGFSIRLILPLKN